GDGPGQRDGRGRPAPGRDRARGRLRQPDQRGQPQYHGRPGRPRGLQGAPGDHPHLRPDPGGRLPRAGAAHHLSDAGRGTADPWHAEGSLRRQPMAGQPMYVIVIGGGKVGYYLTKHLLERSYEVTLIEKDARRAEQLTSQLGEVVMVGDGDEMSFLATTGMERADVVVAVTGDDEDNLIACQLAKRKFKVPKTVARVNNPANVRIFKTLGVDRSLSATEVLLDLIERELSADTAAGRSATKP